MGSDPRASDPRLRAVRTALEELEQVPMDIPSYVVPTSSSQWKRSIEDSGLGDAVERYSESRRTVLAASQSQGTDIALELRPAVTTFVTATRELCQCLELLAALSTSDPKAPQAAADQRARVLRDAHAVCSLSNEVRAELRWTALPVPSTDDRDVFEDLFQVPADDLADAAGLFSPTRLLAAYRLRLPVLEEKCEEVWRLIGDRPPSVFAAVARVPDIVGSSSPAITIWAARQVRQLLLSSFASDPDRTSRVIAASWDERDLEWSSFSRLAARLQQSETADTERERQIAYLEAYKHMLEGLTRRWVWTLLRLTGMDGTAPTVGRLAEPAEARLGRLGRQIAEAIIPDARNAEAHEQIDFDDDAGTLLLGTLPLNRKTLESAFSALDVLQRGWEVGREAALADEPALADAALAKATRASRHAVLEFAEGRFGHAGQAVRKFRREGDLVEVELESLTPHACNPCFVALTQSAARLQHVTRFVVRVHRHPEPVIDLPATVLHANWPVFETAATLFPNRLPQSTFVPCLTWTRLACETPDQALRVAAWFVLNDAQHAVTDTNFSAREHALLADRLHVAAEAGRVTLALFSGISSAPELVRANRILETSCRALARGLTGVAQDVVLDRIEAAREQLAMRPAVLPTLDPTPLAESSYPHAVS